MRKRKEIEDMFLGGNSNVRQRGALLEVLLDIRDLLTPPTKTNELKAQADTL